jgi:[acyl-carrier-protein] S-malonyltransferase
VRLVRQRGQFMQSAVPVGVGAMAAIIGLDDDVINDVCSRVAAEQEGVVAAVNFNSPGQVVIAGHTAAVDAAISALNEAGAKRAISLPVSAPFHTSLMNPAGEQLSEAMASIEFSQPQIPVVHNVQSHTEADPAVIRDLLTEQISSPVQWTGCVQAIRDTGATRLVECGPGKVLSGLNRRIDKSLSSFALENPDALLSAITDISAGESA